MISVLISMFVRNNIKISGNLFKVIVEIFLVVVTTTTLFYAGSAYDFKTSLFQERTNVFHFLVVAELALILPLGFAEKIIFHFQKNYSNHFFQTLSFVKISPYKHILLSSISEMFYPLLRLLSLLTIMRLIFNFQATLIQLVFFSFIQMLSIAMFVLLAFVAIEFFLWFKKGLHFFHTFNSLAVILAGAYFPTKIFPGNLKSFSAFLPQTMQLESVRTIFLNSIFPFDNIIGIFFWIFLLAIFFNVLKRRQKRHVFI
jgi:hypothetical protein